MTTISDPILVATRAAERRAQVELRLLAAIAPLGRYGFGMVQQLGIGIEHFGNEDTAAIFAAMLLAESDGRIVDRSATARLARLALIDLNLWDESDAREWICGMRWGPGPLAVLFTRIDPFVAEQRISILADELLTVFADQQQTEAA
jgi:hypothetical protein